MDIVSICRERLSTAYTVARYTRQEIIYCVYSDQVYAARDYLPRIQWPSIRGEKLSTAYTVARYTRQEIIYRVYGGQVYTARDYLPRIRWPGIRGERLLSTVYTVAKYMRREIIYHVYSDQVYAERMKVLYEQLSYAATQDILFGRVCRRIAYAAEVDYLVMRIKHMMVIICSTGE
jgi:hypothetical protein